MHACAEAYCPTAAHQETRNRRLYHAAHLPMPSPFLTLDWALTFVVAILVGRRSIQYAAFKALEEAANGLLQSTHVPSYRPNCWHRLIQATPTSYEGWQSTGALHTPFRRPGQDVGGGLLDSASHKYYRRRESLIYSCSRL